MAKNLLRTTALIFPLLFPMVTTARGQYPVWKERAPLPRPRAGYMAGVIAGKYVIAGGSYWLNKKKQWTDRVDIFDPRTNTWSPVAPLPAPRSDAAVVSYQNSLYIFGGDAYGNVRRDALRFYHGVWSAIPGGELPEPRVYSVATVCEGKFYLLGGMAKAGDYKHISNQLWVWNPRRPKDGWRTLEPLPGPGLITQAMAEVNGQIYVLGGAKTGGADVVNVKTAYRFDPQRGKWTRLPALPLKRRCWWGVGWKDRIVLIGGYTDTYERDVFSYSPTTDVFSHFGQLPHGVCDAKFLRIGNGIVGTGGEVAPMVRGQWTVEAKMPVENRRK